MSKSPARASRFERTSTISEPDRIIHPEGQGRIWMDLASRGLSLPRNGKDFHFRLARGFWSNKQKCPDMRVLGQFHSFVAKNWTAIAPVSL
jgi:hypothetical protein